MSQLAVDTYRNLAVPQRDLRQRAIILKGEALAKNAAENLIREVFETVCLWCCLREVQLGTLSEWSRPHARRYRVVQAEKYRRHARNYPRREALHHRRHVAHRQAQAIAVCPDISKRYVHAAGVLLTPVYLPSWGVFVKRLTWRRNGLDESFLPRAL